MDHVTIEEQNVVERYLMGRLGAAEATRFEEHYLDCPQCLDHLELSRRIYRGMKEIVAEDGKNLARTAFLAWLLRRGRVLQVTFAAALLAAAILPWALLTPAVSRLSGEHERLTGELAQALSPQARTPIYLLSPERSASAAPSTRITLRSTTPEWVVLALQPPPFASSPTYRVGLRPALTENFLWQSGQLASDASGRVTLSVHSTWLEAADYVIDLEALTPDGEFQPVARFTFQVRHQE